MFGGDIRLVKGWERWKAGKEVEEWMKAVFKKHSEQLLKTEPEPRTDEEIAAEQAELLQEILRRGLTPPAEPAAGRSTGDPKAYLNAVWPEISRSVFGRLSNKLGTRTL